MGENMLRVVRARLGG